MFRNNEKTSLSAILSEGGFYIHGHQEEEGHQGSRLPLLTGAPHTSKEHYADLSLTFCFLLFFFLRERSFL